MLGKAPIASCPSARRALLGFQQPLLFSSSIHLQYAVITRTCVAVLMVTRALAASAIVERRLKMA